MIAFVVFTASKRCRKKKTMKKIHATASPPLHGEVPWSTSAQGRPAQPLRKPPTVPPNPATSGVEQWPLSSAVSALDRLDEFSQDDMPYSALEKLPSPTQSTPASHPAHGWNASDPGPRPSLQASGRCGASPAKPSPAPLAATVTDSLPQDPREAECTATYKFFHPALSFRPRSQSQPLQLRNNVANVRLVLEHHPEWKRNKFRLSTFDIKQRWGSMEVSDAMVTRIVEWLTRFLQGERIARIDVENAIQILTEENKYNDLSDWFLRLPAHDGISRLDTWLTTCFAADNNELNRTLGRKWLIAATARARRPGCYVEGCLVLIGAQASGKSTGLKTLCPRETWFCDANPDLGDRKTATEIFSGKHIVELSELDALSKSSLTAVKSFLTSTHDKFRAAYARRAEEFPRMAIYAATTNEDTFLTDTTGNRRFWCVKVGRTDFEHLQNIKHQLWSEALLAYNSGEDYTLDSGQRALLEEFNSGSMVEDPLVEYLRFMSTSIPDTELTSHALHNNWLASYKRSWNGKQVAAAMRSLGWENAKFTGGVRGYRRLPAVSASGVGGGKVAAQAVLVPSQNDAK